MAPVTAVRFYGRPRKVDDSLIERRVVLADGRIEWAEEGSFWWHQATVQDTGGAS